MLKFFKNSLNKDKSNISSSNIEQGKSKDIGFLSKLKLSLSKTRDGFSKKIVTLFGGGMIDEELYTELETLLLSADVGIKATELILNEIRAKVRLKDLKDRSYLLQELSQTLKSLLVKIENPTDFFEHKPLVIMLVGVNGAGKTTSIGKLTHYFQENGKSVILAAGDTFRAAATEQLFAWGEKNGVTVITQKNGDSAAVCFDAINAAIARKIDVVIADTAGRLPTQLHLMEEIKKVKRVIGKALEGAPHEILLVLDANIGQNALNQLKSFNDALNLTGLIITKLDGTAKGGIICAIAQELPLPLKFIGVGENLDDLKPFNSSDYVDALLN